MRRSSIVLAACLVAPGCTRSGDHPLAPSPVPVAGAPVVRLEPAPPPPRATVNDVAPSPPEEAPRASAAAPPPIEIPPPPAAVAAAAPGGVLVDEALGGTSAIGALGAQAFSLGGDPVAGSFAHVALDDVRVYRRALSAVEVALLIRRPGEETGATFSAFSVELQGASGQRVPEDGVRLTAVIDPETGLGLPPLPLEFMPTLCGPSVAETVAGVATFSGLSLSFSHATRFRVSSGAATTGLSDPTWTRAPQVEFLAPPTDATAFVPVTPSIRVAVLDVNLAPLSSSVTSGVHLRADGLPGPGTLAAPTGLRSSSRRARARSRAGARRRSRRSEGRRARRSRRPRARRPRACRSATGRAPPRS